MSIPVAKLLYSCKYKLNNKLHTKVSIRCVCPALIVVKESTLQFTDNMHNISLPFLCDGKWWQSLEYKTHAIHTDFDLLSFIESATNNVYFLFSK